MRLVYYNANRLLEHKHLFGIKEFLPYFRIYGQGIAPVDRSGVIKFPINTKSLFPLPQMRVFTKKYDEICNERAQELLKRAERLDVPLVLCWSGGIDSTCALVSLLKNTTVVQKQRLLILLSEESITENPKFYHSYIRGQLRCGPATLFPHLIGNNNLFVNGEHNDQLFGSDILADVIARFGFDVVYAPYNRRLLATFLTEKVEDPAAADVYVSLFEQLKETAPIPIKTNYDVFWWINFTLKWQTVYMRMLSYIAVGTPEFYLRLYYAPFFNTEDFQLWSMNSPDQRIMKGWRSYKWIAKELIYNFNKDANYRDSKLKRGSLQHLIMTQVPFDFIDENFNFHKTVNLHECVQPSSFGEGNQYVRGDVQLRQKSGN